MMNRRNFLKIVGSTPTLMLNESPLSAAISCSSDDAQAASALQTSQEPWTIANEHQKLVFISDHGLLSYQSFVRDENGIWKARSLPSNRVVTGASFPLRVESGELTAEGGVSRLSFRGKGQAQGEHSRKVEYPWTCDVTRFPDSSWFRFRTVLHLNEPLVLQQAAAVEPQIIFWLSLTSNFMEGQQHSWDRTLLSQPTHNSLGAYGNNLAAVYLHDWTDNWNNGIETMLFFDMTDMDWMSFDNIPRFLAYRCTMKTIVLAPGHDDLLSPLSRENAAWGMRKHGLGLLADFATGDHLPPRDVAFTWYLLQRRNTLPTTSQQAVRRMMDALLPLFEENLNWPPVALSWKDCATGLVADLQQKDYLWFEFRGKHRALRSYVKGTSAWSDVTDSDNVCEFIAMTSVLWPASLYLKLHRPTDPGHWSGLEESLPMFYHQGLHWMSNSPPATQDDKDSWMRDSWLGFLNGLIRFPWIALIRDNDAFKEMFLKSLGTATDLAKEFHYLFPVNYEVRRRARLFGSGTNYAMNGLYAYANLIAYHMSGSESHLQESKNALEIMGLVPDERLFDDTMQLAFGSLAAAKLYSLDGNEKWRELQRYLIGEQLREFYWYSDRTGAERHDVRGMAEGTASLLYPAFFENGISMLCWSGILREGLIEEPWLRFMDQQRRNNLYFLEACRNPGASRKIGDFVPYENLGMLELGGQTGKVGKEIYGSGEVLWMYLLFEALGTLDDREVMLLNLNLLDFSIAKEFPPASLHFVLYNPTKSPRAPRLSIPWASAVSSRLLVSEEGDTRPTNAIPIQSSISVRPQSFRYLRVDVHGV